MAGASAGARVALIAGVRTPFTRTGTALRASTALELGVAVVGELIVRAGVSARDIERVVFGQVVPSLAVPNIAREIVLDAGLPRDTDSATVSRACTTGHLAVIDLARAIAAGEIAAGIAGGADSASDVPVAVSRKLARAVMKLGRARSVGDRVRALRDLAPRDLVPEPPALVERSTGLSLGEHAERMAMENGISRAAQDELAHRSHTLAARAWADGRYAEEVMTVYVPPGYDGVGRDNLVRAPSTLADFARARPVVDDRRGTVTAANSAPVGDGASAVVLMREDRARALGLRPLGYLRGHALTASDPRGQLLLGPAHAIPRALDAAGVRFSDVTLLDLHEAFAAQVLSVTRALEAIGPVDWDRINVMGGSLALGHPFAATGARQLTQLARELARRGGGIGVAAACAAGGLGAALVVEVEP